MSKDLSYYMSLDYKIEIEAIPKNEGGGYIARLPQFGKYGIIGDGDTREEALADLDKAKDARFARYLKENTTIPEPEHELEEYSGRLLLRLPLFLHRDLAIYAQKNNTSLNTLITSLLSSSLQIIRDANELKRLFEEIRSDFFRFKYYVGKWKSTMRVVEIRQGELAIRTRHERARFIAHEKFTEGVVKYQGA